MRGIFRRASQGFSEKKDNMVIYFKDTSNIFGINLKEQGLSLLLSGTLTNNSREQLNLLMGNKGENRSRNKYPPARFPRVTFNSKSEERATNFLSPFYTHIYHYFV